MAHPGGEAWTWAPTGVEAWTWPSWSVKWQARGGKERESWAGALVELRRGHGPCKRKARGSGQRFPVRRWHGLSCKEAWELPTPDEEARV